jgi:ABC-2 type transport system permease protein
MKALIIAGKDLRTFSRDRSGLTSNILMPLILIIVLGITLANAFGSTPALERFSIGIVDEDGGQLTAACREALTAPGLVDLVEERPLSRSDAEAEVAAGRLSGAIIFPSDYTQSVTAGRPAQLTVLVDPAAGTKGQIIEAIAQGFSDRILAVQFALTNSVARTAAMPQLAAELTQWLTTLKPQFTEQVTTARRVTALQYYAISMTVMFLGFSGMTGLQSIRQERDTQTINRILAAPGSRFEFVGGKFLGVLSIAAAQFAVLVMGTSLIYRVSWGTNLGGTILLALAYAFTISGLSTLVSAYNSNPRTAVSTWALTIQVMSALGGNMVPLAMFPEPLRRVAAWLPNNWAMNGFIHLALGKPLLDLLPKLGGLFAIGAIAFTVGAWRLARD